MLGSLQDILVIAVVALLVVGPKKLPEMARTLGKGFSEFKKATEGVTEELKEALKEEVKPDHDEAPLPIITAPEEVKPEEEKPEEVKPEETKSEASDNDAGEKQKSNPS
ncbi:MAG: twin-arginine translocase TatA/TatE family subunit [Smithella sp.]|jgi:TatA/E family protein of Tat protein translocase